MDLITVIASIIALIILEIVLGIDNLVFLSILTQRLPLAQRKQARRWGLTFAWVTRLLLLASAVYLVKLSKPFMVLFHFSFSIRDIFLFLGGMFLIWKATEEIHQEVTDDASFVATDKKNIVIYTFWRVVIQVAIMDIIFSLDSVLTAVGLTNDLRIMSFAITCAILIMIYASEPVSQFISRYPTIKMLALSFLILIGMILIADSFSFHIPRGYIYFAMGFSLAVESLNLIKKSKRKRRK
jgi:predicted tellurium resistance membrane protein TerC